MAAEGAGEEGGGLLLQATQERVVEELTDHATHSVACACLLRDADVNGVSCGGDAVEAQRVAEAPKILDDVAHWIEGGGLGTRVTAELRFGPGRNRLPVPAEQPHTTGVLPRRHGRVRSKHQPRRRWQRSSSSCAEANRLHRAQREKYNRRKPSENSGISGVIVSQLSSR